MRSPKMASSLQPLPLKTEAMKLHRELYIRTTLAMPYWGLGLYGFRGRTWWDLNAGRLLKSTGLYNLKTEIDFLFFINK
jgi:hypothetical protein